MRSHEIDYEILGNDMQIVEVELDPGETVIAEAGAMNYRDDGIQYEAQSGNHSSSLDTSKHLRFAAQRGHADAGSA